MNTDIKEKLYEQCVQNTKPFRSCFFGYEPLAKVLEVYDGDTMTVIFDWNAVFYQFKVRLNGIDTCELKSGNTKLKALAIRARQRVVDLITNKHVNDNKDVFHEDSFFVSLKCYGFDKYGRLLCDVFTDDEERIDIAKTLVDERLAYRYYGDRKLTEDEQTLVFDQNTTL